MKKREDFSPWALIEDIWSHDRRDVFNDDVEEERYQAFKERLLKEIVARERSPHTAMWIEQSLHDTTKGED